MCPLCDGFGVIDDPLQDGRLKKCPECDTEPPWYLRMNMAMMLFGPDGPTEDDDMTPIQEARQRAIREEEVEYMLKWRLGLIPGDPYDGVS